MARLKSRNSFPPLGFQFLQPQTNWTAPPNASFDVVVRALIEHRLANPFIVKQHNLATSYEAVADEVDFFNAARCLANPRWANFVEDGGGGGSAGFWKPRRLKQNVADVAGRVKKTAAGVGLLRDWLGDGLHPAEQDLADERSAICSECPENGDPDWLQKLEGNVAEEIRLKMEIRNDLKLVTKHDESLKTCLVCDCYLKLKTFTPIKHILANTPMDIMEKLDDVRTNSGKKCWITSERNAAQSKDN